MLYQQAYEGNIMLIDDYLGQIEAALNDDGTEPCDRGALVERTISVFIGDIPDIGKGLDHCKSRATAPGSVVKYDDEGDLKKLRDKLLLKKEVDAKKELDDPSRIAIREVNEDIAKCDKVLATGNLEEADYLVELIVRTYGKDIEDIALALPAYDLKKEGKTALDDLPIIKKHLEHHESELALKLAEMKDRSVNVTASAQNANSEVLNITMKQVFQQMQQIPDNELSKEQEKELKALLVDLEAQRGESKESSKGVLHKALDWLSDKGVDVGTAMLPYLASWAQTLQ